MLRPLKGKWRTADELVAELDRLCDASRVLRVVSLVVECRDDMYCLNSHGKSKQKAEEIEKIERLKQWMIEGGIPTGFVGLLSADDGEVGFVFYRMLEETKSIPGANKYVDEACSLVFAPWVVKRGYVKTVAYTEELSPALKIDLTDWSPATDPAKIN